MFMTVINILSVSRSIIGNINQMAGDNKSNTSASNKCDVSVQYHNIWCVSIFTTVQGNN